MGAACAKCLGGSASGGGGPVCGLCKGTGICNECKGEGGWVVELEVMRTEKKKVVIEGLNKIQEQLVTVYLPDNKPCPKCGVDTTKRLELQATSSVVHGNVYHKKRDVPVSSHLGASQVQYDYLNRVERDVNHKDNWKGSGKCIKCHGLGVAPPSPTRKKK